MDSLRTAYTPSAAPVQIFLTPQQAMALCQPEAKSNPAPPQQPEKSSNDKLKEAIPGPLKAVIHGIQLPGTQASIKPRFDNGMSTLS